MKVRKFVPSTAADLKRYAEAGERRREESRKRKEARK